MKMNIQLKGIVEFSTICCQAAKNRQVKNLPSNLMPLHSPVGLLGKPWCIKNNPDLSNVNHIMFQSIQLQWSKTLNRSTFNIFQVSQLPIPIPSHPPIHRRLVSATAPLSPRATPASAAARTSASAASRPSPRPRRGGPRWAPRRHRPRAAPLLRPPRVQAATWRRPPVPPATRWNWKAPGRFELLGGVGLKGTKKTWFFGGTWRISKLQKLVRKNSCWTMAMLDVCTRVSAGLETWD